MPFLTTTEWSGLWVPRGAAWVQSCELVVTLPSGALKQYDLQKKSYFIGLLCSINGSGVRPICAQSLRTLDLRTKPGFLDGIRPTLVQVIRFLHPFRLLVDIHAVLGSYTAMHKQTLRLAIRTQGDTGCMNSLCLATVSQEVQMKLVAMRTDVAQALVSVVTSVVLIQVAQPFWDGWRPQNQESLSGEATIQCKPFLVADLCWSSMCPHYHTVRHQEHIPEMARTLQALQE